MPARLSRRVFSKSSRMGHTRLARSETYEGCSLKQRAAPLVFA